MRVIEPELPRSVHIDCEYRKSEKIHQSQRFLMDPFMGDISESDSSMFSSNASTHSLEL